MALKVPRSADAGGARSWPLKAYLIGLVVVFVAAAAANVAYQRQATSKDARDAAIADAAFAAKVAARDVAAAVEVAQTTVASTAAAPGLAQVFAGPTACTLAFSGAGPFHTGHVDVVGPDGVVGCSSVPTSRAPVYGDAAWLAAAQARPTVQAMVNDDRTGKQVTLVAAPVPGGGAVVGFLDLDSVGPRLATTLGGARDLEFLMTNADGTVVLARSIKPSRSIGTKVAGTPFAGTMGDVQHDDLDGTTRIYHQERVPDLGWTVFAGADESEALAAANSLADRQLVITGVALMLILASALVIHRRIANDLVATLRRELAERERAQAEQQVLQAQLHQSQRHESLGQLAGGIAHDFNNLLGAIMNYAEFVKEETVGQTAVQADVEQIRLASERAARLTRQLLVFARREPPQPEILDLNVVVEDMRNLLSRSLGTNIILSTESEANLSKIRADRGQMEQILVNLAVNARDAMPNGGTLTITTSAAELDAGYLRLHPDVTPGHYVELEVSDSGTGMNREVVDQIFDPFFTTKPRGEGSGLGLATVQGIVAAGGGTMSVFSEEGIGTTFRLYFRAVDAPTAPASLDDAATRGRGETILVVEDEPAELELTSRILRQHGYVVLEASTFEEAIALASSYKPNLLLTDSVMPKVAGKTLAERLEELWPGRPVLFMSGSVAESFGACVQKPFSQRTLLEAVRASLDSVTG